MLVGAIETDYRDYIIHWVSSSLDTKLDTMWHYAELERIRCNEQLRWFTLRLCFQPELEPVEIVVACAPALAKRIASCNFCTRNSPLCSGNACKIIANEAHKKKMKRKHYNYRWSCSATVCACLHLICFHNCTWIRRHEHVLDIFFYTIVVHCHICSRLDIDNFHLAQMSALTNIRVSCFSWEHILIEHCKEKQI